MRKLVDNANCEYLPLFCKIDDLAKKKKLIMVAIDGNSAAGKSSLAALLESVYPCHVFSMDDFFLQPFQRTHERLNEPGGNVDYERFRTEIIEPLEIGRPFSYRAYDCRTQGMSKSRRITPKQLSIIEGVYCLHPHLIGAYDIKVFLCLDPKEQRRRLLARNEGLYDRYAQEWVPMENKYFEEFQVTAKCDFVFKEGCLCQI